MAKREFTAVYQKRGNRYIAWIEEVPGVNTQGKTRKETKENLKEALFLILESNRKLASKQRGGLMFREPLCIGVPA
ncbi:MAG: hypothetical protein A3H69_00220 [Candidatus Sungbacteria bacterium RIFCSPLOWO2_02_FULL_47_9]|uniref:HicB-like antitoxin of toxin-antitoxin system domain-containing protein n=1 Tax=Candidatus Sungbacteria bacterium RIFCSPHIGHO2_01_FULL_47_32 TaxID=1802264 RepID=A0A1G2K8C6_9BACT|nr:MAG: hypothetical protein UX72_C0034G0012 [Parcubacteria group bacterium GW2011_GWA2_47_10]OGZ95463.1 MAG: hypothetical protein A2633_03615 [Candidatus Sungbacteria bacterium RIFCSPHIGHO2_01_FULL_47_32]OGZ99919.1 MAG: hypothetical protein A3D57_03655 [Candidatus Sungbacteria bacterium RIFCSPHIGHO2_02_FULL_46_12]OHA05326.1 MAG: hypothetical protein A3A28_00430 [Candidatus Sungbacteria bacterium RIFCSPLOWO2_01_FULL_47_32]OHA10616.1 MAG: hypothetical protein A3H69_00220 [Candidatus Sungbacteria